MTPDKIDPPEDPTHPPRGEPSPGGPGAQECLITPADAARLLNVGVSTVNRWLDLKVLRGRITEDRRYWIEMQDLLDFSNHHGIPLSVHTFSARRSVLLVDDDENFLKLLAATISNHRPDIDVFTTTSGFYAGVLVIRHHPQLILLDIRMPELNGVDVCRILKEDPTMSDICVVAVTGETDSAKVQAIRQAGAADVLFKPVKNESIHTLLDRVIPKV